MLTMNKFHELLSASSESQGSYLWALKAFTRISPAQLVSMTEGLGWIPC